MKKTLFFAVVLCMSCVVYGMQNTYSLDDLADLIAQTNGSPAHNQACDKEVEAALKNALLAMSASEGFNSIAAGEDKNHQEILNLKAKLNHINENTRLLFNDLTSAFFDNVPDYNQDKLKMHLANLAFKVSGEIKGRCHAIIEQAEGHEHLLKEHVQEYVQEYKDSCSEVMLNNFAHGSPLRGYVTMLSEQEPPIKPFGAGLKRRLEALNNPESYKRRAFALMPVN